MDLHGSGESEFLAKMSHEIRYVVCNFFPFLIIDCVDLLVLLLQDAYERDHRDDGAYARR